MDQAGRQSAESDLTHHEPSNRNPGALQVHLLRIKEKRNKYDYNQGWNVDLFQGLGCREARRILAWLAAERGRMDAQMLFLGQRGYHVIAHDRRGNGRSGQTWGGNNLDTYADDLAEVIEALDLKDAMLVGHSTGGGEVTRYVGRHGNKRLSKLVLIGAIPPVMKSEKNPGGLPLSAFDELRAGMVADRSQFMKDLSMPFYGYNKPGAKISQGVRDFFWLQAMQASVVGTYDCIKAFSETDLTEDLKKIDVPTLILHGDQDQIVPIADSALLSSKIIKNATLKIYPGAPHGMTVTLADKVNADLLAFLES